jgi:FixJ family two-component response regulator
MTSEARPLVYVVDDEPGLRSIIVRTLEKSGYDAEAFASGADFLARKRQDRPAALLCDVMLVEGTGFDLLTELQKRGERLPTVFMTGGGTIPMSVQAMKLGAIEFLTKPLDWNQVHLALAHALERAEAARQLQAEAARIEALLEKLTPRERSVLPWVAKGLPNKRIAAELDIVEQTVKVHRGRIMEKLAAGSVADLVRLVDRAVALGISIEPKFNEPSSNTDPG